MIIKIIINPGAFFPELQFSHHVFFIKKTIRSFINILQNLSEKKSGKKKIDKYILLKEIEASTPAEKQWLTEKIKEM